MIVHLAPFTHGGNVTALIADPSREENATQDAYQAGHRHPKSGPLASIERVVNVQLTIFAPPVSYSAEQDPRSQAEKPSP